MGPVVGQVLGHYRILEEIGAGGMGVVYRAHDERLDRDVALKVLPQGALGDERARRRLREEAVALARLNHPNIATIHDFDSQGALDFLVMEHVVGVTLADKLAGTPLPESELLLLAEQITKPLQEAHEHGVIHRDLKPGNIIVTAKGQLKLLDFGLAQLLAGGGSLPTETTASQHIVGTLPYMAPEQLSGQCDCRTDIYAVGAILYEMATGRRPFSQRFAGALASDIINTLPVPPGQVNPRVSRKLEDVILKCLEKDPNNRYQSAQEITVDLRRQQSATHLPATIRPVVDQRRRLRAALASALAVLAVLALLLGLRYWRDPTVVSPNRIRSLAVLPLDNLSGDPEQEYFTEGMTDELITALGQYSALNVISRTSVMRYKGAQKTVPEIARELHVDAILQGSVLRSGNRTRITAQLTDGVSDRNLWGRSYERDMRDVLALQDEVARAIADEIEVRLTGGRTKAITAAVVAPEAHEAYLRGRYYWNKWTPDGFQKAGDYFQRALAIDANYPAAHAGLADAHALLGYYGVVAPRDAFPRAKAAALNALALDETLSEAHTALALVAENYEWDWDGGERELARALQLNPSSAMAHLWYSYHLVWFGRFDEAVKEAQRAQALDPLSLVTNTSVANILYDVKRYDEAIVECRKVLEMDSSFRWAHHSLGENYVEKGLFKEAVTELTLGLDQERRNPHFLAALAYGMARSGDRVGALKIVEELERASQERYIPATQIAGLYATLGKTPESLAWLEKAYQARDAWLPQLTVTPPFRSLHADPRFREFMARIGLRVVD